MKSMNKLDEIERMEKSVYNRWASEHPFMWPIIASLVIMGLGKVVDYITRPPAQPAPIVNVHVAKEILKDAK